MTRDRQDTPTSERYARFALPGMERPVYYTSSAPLEEGSRSRLAVIHIHGWGNGVNVARTDAPMAAAIASVMGGEDPYVVSPLFPRAEILERSGVGDDGRAVWNGSWGKALDKAGSPDDDWRGGGDAGGTKTSSFEVVDDVLAALGDRSRFPNLQRVVLAGYSAGGQFVGRYAAVGKGVVSDGVELEFAAMAPSTELLLDPGTRWHYGLKGMPRYSAGMTMERILANLSSRRVWRACGTADVLGAPHTALDSCPEAMAQGANRYERFRNFEKYLSRHPAWAAQVSFHAFEGVAHNSLAAYTSREFATFAAGSLMRGGANAEMG